MPHEINVFVQQYPWISGWVASLGLGSAVTHLIGKYMRCERKRRLKNSGFTEPTAKYPDSGLMSWLLGIVERILFVLALVFGKETFIGLWLTGKFAGHWRQYNSEELEGWGRINIFLIGNGLSLLFALWGAHIIKPFVSQ